MARPSGPKTRNSGRWTEARFHSFIKSLLRSGTRRWGPISDALKAGRVSRGIYKCNVCKKEVPNTIKDGNKRKKNVFVDHIEPIIDPYTGFKNWDDTIDRMFCETDNLQVICGSCHEKKTIEERRIAKERRKNNDA